MIYGDREKNSDVDIGQAEALGEIVSDPSKTIVARRQETAGTIAGVDWTYFRSGPDLRGVQVGLFGGYNDTRSQFSDGQFATVESDLNNPATLAGVTYDRLGAKETTEGGFVGTYLVVFRGKFTADLTFKADFFDFEHEDTIQRDITCNFSPIVRRAEVDQTDYIVASNLAYRFDLSPSQWFEPVAGVRYTFTDFGRAEGNIDIGSEDGEIFRVQGGFRVGTAWLTPAGNPAVLALTSLLYSDVMIDGFVGPDSGVVLSDEGKLRFLGLVSTSIGLGRGVSFIGELEGRTGDDYYGYGGRAGFRYEW